MITTCLPKGIVVGRIMKAAAALLCPLCPFMTDILPTSFGANIVLSLCNVQRRPAAPDFLLNFLRKSVHAEFCATVGRNP
jgi:hypothetical protein